jgi:BirA family biotin operon repressor/biotin-[acetyl-CoA-carboxylase] ligase
VELGRVFGVSRAAIWKVMQKLEDDFSLTVFAVKGKGYRLEHALEFLDKQTITKYLTQQTAAHINEFEIFYDINSTNHYLNVKSLGGAQSGHVVLAEQQSNGQGRRGRTWVSPFACNLYLSVLWRFPCGPSQLGCLSLFIAVAVVRALQKSGITDAGVKWPNDIYWQNKKLAGILLEMRGEANGPSAVVVGVGLNIAMKPDTVNEISQPWVDLETILQTKVDRNYFTALVINALFDVLSLVPDKKQELLKEWQEMDVLRGEDINIEFADKVIHGKALGINQDGALRVMQNNNEIICHSGDVSIRRRD